MIKQSRFLLVFIVLLLAVVLTACGGAAPSESWPGVTVDATGQSAFVAYTTNIFQVNLANGAETWRYPAEANNKVNFYAPPYLTDGGDLLVGGYDHVFYNIKIGSNQAAWSFAEAKDRFVGQALVVGDTVLAPSADGRLYGLNLQNGALRWKFSGEHAMWAAPILVGDVLYQASMDHHIYALNAQTGEMIWETGDLGGQIVAAPAVSADGSVLYTSIFGSRVDDPQRSSQVIAVNAQNGDVIWQSPVTGWVWATPLLHEDTLYFGDMAGYFYAFDAQQGTLRWKYPQSGEPKARTGILGRPAIAGDRIYFGSEAGVLTALNLGDGALLWEKSPWDEGKTAQIFADVQVVNDTLLIAPSAYDSAILMALDLDGNLKWQYLPARK